MSRIVRPEEGLPLTPFEEAPFTEADIAGEAPSLTEELITPEERLRRADEEARVLIEHAEAQAADIRRAAESRGRAVGEATGTAQGMQEYEAMTGTLRAVAEAVQAEQQRLEAQLTDNVVALALAIVQRMLGDITGDHPETMRHVTTQAVRALSERGAVAVHVHPTVVDVVERERESLQQAFPDVHDLTIVADDAVAPGGCLLDTPTIQLDATVERVIERIRAEAVPGGGRIDAPTAAEEEA